MDKRSDDIRQNIEDTRASIDEKIDMLQGKASEAVEQTKQLLDVNHQVSERPWVALGLALAAGYVVGNLGNDSSSSTTSSYSQNYSQSYGNAYSGPSTMDTVKSKGRDFLSQFDDEIDLLKTAAITTLTQFIRDAAREAVPALGPQIDKLASQFGASGNSGGGYSGSGGSGSGYSGSSTLSSGSSNYGSSYSSPSTSDSTYSSSGLSSSTPSTAPNNSMDVGTHEGGVNLDSMPQYNRYGNTPTIPTKDDEEYYTTYQPDEDTREVGGR